MQTELNLKIDDDRSIAGKREEGNGSVASSMIFFDLNHVRDSCTSRHALMVSSTVDNTRSIFCFDRFG
jgi:hypothetical protein